MAVDAEAWEAVAAVCDVCVIVEWCDCGSWASECD